MSRIELKHIDKFYGDNHVLRDINLVIEDGDFMTLLGPSGCGKTTTLRVVSGLEKPQNGVMTIDGVEMINADLAYYAEPSKRGLNLVFQSYALWPHMTVKENIAFGLKIQKLPKEEIERRIHEALRMMRIEEYIDRYPNELSGGQQQRVAIARAIASSPKL
ncbi:MAG: ABC transporter ATP-binding protein, partial [Oscillospiraceae bacterium]|nr:ABC transporter ATP-binding protein [Oscillospiraceae bacterium]